MKRIAFTICMIALLVGVAFAGMAASTNQGSPPWNSLEQKIDALNTNVTNLQGNVSTVKTDVAAINTNIAAMQTKLANVTKMETVYGSYEVLLFSGAVTVYEVQYDEPRHVSLTLQWDGLVVPTTEAIAVDAFVTGTPSWPEGIVYICLPDYAAHGIETVEFNADHWFINVVNDHVWNDYIYYAATVTYPLQP